MSSVLYLNERSAGLYKVNTESVRYPSNYEDIRLKRIIKCRLVVNNGGRYNNGVLLLFFSLAAIIAERQVPTRDLSFGIFANLVLIMVPINRVQTIE